MLRLPVPFGDAMRKAEMLLALVCFWLLSVAPADAGDDSAFSYPEDHWCEQVQRMLNVPLEGQGVLDGLARIFSEAQDRQQALAAAKNSDDLDGLAKVVLSGSEPRLLEERVLEWTTVANRFRVYGPPGWKFGDGAVRNQLLRHMWEKAESLSAADPRRAARLAKAATVLAAQDLFDSSPLHVFLRKPQFAAITGADAKAAQALLDQIIPSKRAADAGSKRLIAVAGSLNRCIDADRAKQPYDKDAESLISGFRQSWPDATSRNEAWRDANLLWRFLCLSRANHDEKSIQAVTQLVQDLAPKTPDKHARRWLEEVLTTPGDRPKDSGVQIFTEPNQLKPKGGP